MTIDFKAEVEKRRDALKIKNDFRILAFLEINSERDDISS